jgi:sensor histidine kinase YesM
MTSLFRHRLVFWPLVAIVTFFLVMGLSGVVYFGIELVEPLNMPTGIAFGVVLGNLAGAAAAMLVVLPYYRRGIRRPTVQRTTWKRYALIGLLTTVLNFLFSMLVGIFYWRPLYQNVQVDWKQQASFNPFYLLPPVIAAWLLYYWLTRERSQTVKISEQEFELMQLNDLKTRAELDALQAKINPHFLYNALNSIASLVHLDPDRAERMTMLLSKFYRSATTKNDQYFDTLETELDMVQTYLDVEKVRFDERLTYRIELEDESLKQVPVPRFLLQPLVENAIKHGISRRAGGGPIRIRAAREGGVLVLRIYDNGPDFPEAMNLGYGLRSIQDKLRLLCGTDACLDLVNGDDKHVEVRLPMTPEKFKPEAPARPAAVSVPD